MDSKSSCLFYTIWALISNLLMCLTLREAQEKENGNLLETGYRFPLVYIVKRKMSVMISYKRKAKDI